MKFNHGSAASALENNSVSKRSMPIARTGRKINRNEPCPCGSKKKYKHCCGKL